MEKEKKKRLPLYAVCVLLILFYITVMWWGINPNVGTEYRMYYITHELSDWPGYGKLSYKFGTKEIATSRTDRDGKSVEYDACMRKGQGWKKEQYDGSTNPGGESSIYYIPETAAGSAVYTVEIKEYSADAGSKAYEDGTVSVYANGVYIGRIDGEGTYKFNVGAVEAQELLKISFEAENASFTLWSAVLDTE